MFRREKKHLQAWRIWRLFPIFHGASFSHRRRCSPVQAAGKVSSPHFRSTHAESQQQHKKGKALTGIHANLSMWFYKVTCCKHLPKYTEPSAVQTRPGDRHCRLFQTPCFWGGTWILLTWCIRKQGNRSRSRNASWLHQPWSVHALGAHTFYL